VVFGRSEESHKALPVLLALCFCEAGAEYKQEFWSKAPPQLVEELQTLGKSQDRLGDVLIRMKKLQTPQLLDALVEQRETGRKLGEILIGRGLVTAEDVESALRSRASTGWRTRAPAAPARPAAEHPGRRPGPTRARRPARLGLSLAPGDARSRCATASTASRSGSARSALVRGRSGARSSDVLARPGPPHAPAVRAQPAPGSAGTTTC
jgi:hypothetical protein